MDLDAISIFITAAVCSAIFALVKSSAKKQNKNMTINNFEIIYSPALIRTSYFFAIFIIVFSIWLYPYIVKDSNPYVVYPIFVCVPLFFLVFGLILNYISISICNDSIKVKHFLQKEKEYKMSDITKVKNGLGNDGEIKVYVGKKRIFTFSKLMTGYDLMCQKLNKLNF